MMERIDKISIETTQNVRLEYEVASVFDRMLAWFIDMLIVGLYIFVTFFTIYKLNIFEKLGRVESIWIIVLVMLPYFFYHLLFEILMDGQSIGKRIRKIKVIKIDGTSPSIGDYIIRWLVRILEESVFPGLCLVAVLASSKGQRIGDVAASTAVAKIKQRVGLEDTILNYTQNDYVPTYPSVLNLSAKDVEVIKYVLNATQQSNRYYIVSECSVKVATILDLTMEGRRDHEAFLRVVLNDYTYYASKEY